MSVRSGPSTAIVAVCMGIAFLGVPLLFVLCLVASTSGARPLGLFYLALAAIGFVGVPAVVAIDSIRQRNADPTVRVSAERLREFAKDNAFTYAPVGHFSAAPGIFLSTHGGSAVDVIMGRHGLSFAMGSVGTVGAAAEPSFFGGGFVVIHGQRPLPHLFAVPRSVEAGDTALERWGLEESGLSLEGDFDARFALYVPEGYERDALYVLTPDVMSAMVDEAGDFFIETYGTSFYVFSTEPFIGGGEELYRRLFGIVETLGGQAHQQTDGYAHRRDSEPARLVLGRGLGFLRPMVQAAVVFLVICLVPWIVYSVVA